MSRATCRGTRTRGGSKVVDDEPRDEPRDVPRDPDARRTPLLRDVEDFLGMMVVAVDRLERWTH
jgi:hypothetical protein